MLVFPSASDAAVALVIIDPLPHSAGTKDTVGKEVPVTLNAIEPIQFWWAVLQNREGDERKYRPILVELSRRERTNMNSYFLQSAGEGRKEKVRGSVMPREFQEPVQFTNNLHENGKHQALLCKGHVEEILLSSHEDNWRGN